MYPPILPNPITPSSIGLLDAHGSKKLPGALKILHARSEIPAFAGFRGFFSRIEAVFAGFELPNHAPNACKRIAKNPKPLPNSDGPMASGTDAGATGWPLHRQRRVAESGPRSEFGSTSSRYSRGCSSPWKYTLAR